VCHSCGAELEFGGRNLTWLVPLCGVQLPGISCPRVHGDAFWHLALFERNFDFAPAGEDARTMEIENQLQAADGRSDASGWILECDQMPDKPKGNGKSEIYEGLLQQKKLH